jgi:peroxiredoxin
MNVCKMKTLLRGVVVSGYMLITLSSVLAAELRKVDDFQLVNCQGGTCRLSDYEDRKFVVLAFLGTECPLAKLYAVRLQALADEFADQGLLVFAVNANAQDSLSEMRSFVKAHRFTVPFLKDAHYKLTDQLGATRTPEVFLLDADGNVRYQGRIDDQYGISEARETPQREDLKIAIEELIAGREVSVPKTTAAGCLLGRRPESAEAVTVTYSNQVSRILQNRCVECHRDGQIGPFSLTSYEDVAAWAEMIDEVVQDGRMPPWHADPAVGTFKNARNLSKEEKATIKAWVKAGAPLGEPKELPEPRAYVDGWQLPREPDMVIPMRDTPYDVAAEGVIKYQYFVADPGFTEDKFVTACEVLPGNRKVVHHVLIFALPPGKQILGVDDDGFLFAYVPGLGAQQLPPGMAKRVPAGSKLLFQIHYTPIGTPQQDLSSVGLLFTDPATITHEVYTASATNKQFVIPPREANHRVESISPPMPADCELLYLDAHMHVRGKSFAYEAVFTDGTRKPLLNLPHYDFNWQTNYELAEHLPLPEGTVIHGKATFDNSENNASNPDPNSEVRWGEQTWEEMMIGYFTVAVPVTSNRGGLNPFERQKIVSTVDKLVFSKLDHNHDGILIADETGGALWVFGKAMSIDVDNDEQLCKEELRGWLTEMDNPLDLLENPLIRQIPEVAKLIKRMEGKH